MGISFELLSLPHPFSIAPVAGGYVHLDRAYTQATSHLKSP